MKNTLIYTALFLFIFTSCQKELMEQTVDTDVPIIETYSYAGDTAVQVNITKLLPFTVDGDSEQSPISGLSVSLLKNGTTYLLNETSNGNYGFSDPGFQIQPGDQLELNFAYNSKIVAGTTVIPDKPQGMVISPSPIYMEKIEEGEFGQNFTDPVQVFWNNPEGDYYFIKMDYMESDLDLVNENFAGNDLPTSTTTDLLNNGIYEIRSRNLYFFGNYRIILYHVNQEYADLFETINQSSQNLTDPISSIENGWGIFTGLNADTLYLEVLEY